MSNIFFISDTHFYHANILKFTDSAGKLVRPGFQTAEEMNEAIVERWNSVVKPGDKVYHLGDVAMGPGANNENMHTLLRRLHGRKRLVLGNHDHGLAEWIRHNFDKVMLWRNFDTFTCSHIPLRLDQLRKRKVNVHGHIHQNLMDEPQYINVCVEHTNYTPVPMETILGEIKNRSL